MKWVSTYLKANVYYVLYAFLLYNIENKQTYAILDQPFQGTTLNWYLCGNIQT